jgi:alpha-galactosidase
MLRRFHQIAASLADHFSFRSVLCSLALLGTLAEIQGVSVAAISEGQIAASVRSRDGAYEIRSKGLDLPVITSAVAVEVDHRWVSSREYRTHHLSENSFQDPLGNGHQITVTFPGLASRPAIAYLLRIYEGLTFGTIEVEVRNTTSSAMRVQGIRSVDAIGPPFVNLGGPDAVDRVLSDSFSEDRPPLHIFDLGNAPEYVGNDKWGREPGSNLLGVGSQLIFNRQSGYSLFLGALTSRLWLTYLRLGVSRNSAAEPQIQSLAVESAGTTEMVKRDSLRDSSADDQIELSLPLPPGERLSSEVLMFSAGPYSNSELDRYGKAVQLLHHARVRRDNLMGWWSWSVYYSQVTAAEVISNAEWLAQHLKAWGYNSILIDEGYDYARGEYTTPNAKQFPHGMREIGQKLHDLGINLGLWTAPFEVSEQAWAYQHHPEWLVRNAKGNPIRIQEGGDRSLYVLDTTNPAAQSYLRQTYQTMAQQWGVRFIKLDFMDDTAIEGFYHRPNTTAMEAQRIGLQAIRDALGDGVLLDKDGSPMLNPVGIVDEGRVSLDSSHRFQTIKDLASGVAARYDMNRTFFVADPDAFAISDQEQPEHESPPLTASEAQMSIVLAAMSGGMYEIGDDLSLLAREPARLDLLENPDLLHIVHLGRAAVPLDLMSYAPEDQQPSTFLLRENSRQAYLAVFNWTDEVRSRRLSFSELGFDPDSSYQTFDVLSQAYTVASDAHRLEFYNQPPHSVRLLKIVELSSQAASQ